MELAVVSLEKGPLFTLDQGVRTDHISNSRSGFHARLVKFHIRSLKKLITNWKYRAAQVGKGLEIREVTSFVGLEH